MAVSKYDKERLSSSQQAAIDRVTKMAQSGSMSWADAHNQAESIRNSAGYSGGRYGNEYNSKGSSGKGSVKSGAAAGAAIGSLFPGGSAIGAVLGGLASAIGNAAGKNNGGSTHWSPSQSTGQSGQYGGSVYDQQYFTPDELRQAYEIRNAAQSGKTSWADAHNFVENLRNQYGYSGGDDGSQYNPLPQDPYAQQLKDLQAQLEALASQKPSYSGDPYDTSGVIDKLTNMDYADWTQSDQYKALADRYGVQGQMSMQDVLGQISSRTGGLASSYATTAAQQQYNEYMSQLEEVARQMYSGDRSDLIQNLGVMNDANDSAYNRYLNELGQYNTDYGNLYGAYRDAVGDLKYNQEQEYQKGRDQISDERYNQEYSDSQAATSKADAQNRINAYLAAYGTVKDLDPALVSASGYTQSELNTLAKYYADQKAQEQAAAARKSSGSGGSRSGSSSGSKSSGKPTLTAAQTLNALENGVVNDTTRAAYEYYYGQPYDDGGTEDTGSDASISNRHGDSWIYIPGHGRFSYQEVQDYIDSGKVIESYDKSTNTYSYRWYTNKKTK
jgi:hypothetical protein